MKKIILSILLIVYIAFSFLFVVIGDAQDSWAEIGATICIPCWLIIGGYYLHLIWREGKATGADMLLLPLLQKIGIYKSYNDSEHDRKLLANTTVPFLLSLVICPMLFAIIAGKIEYNSDALSVILIIPIVLTISLVLAAKQDWLNKSGQN